MSRLASRLGAASALLAGFGFGGPGIYAIWHLARRGEIAQVAGYPTYGDGPFEQVGITTSVPLLAAFLGVCAGEVAMGWGLWKGYRRAATSAFAMLPVEVAFCTGFALPLGPLLGIVRTVAVVAMRRDEAEGSTADARLLSTPGAGRGEEETTSSRHA